MSTPPASPPSGQQQSCFGAMDNDDGSTSIGQGHVHCSRAAHLFAECAKKAAEEYDENEEELQATKAEAARLNQEHAAEVAKINEEVAKLKQEHAAVVAKLKQEHATVVAKINEEVAKLKQEHAAVVAKLNEEHAAVVAKINEERAAKVARLKQVARLNKNN